MTTFGKTKVSLLLATALTAAAAVLPTAPATAAAGEDFELTISWDTIRLPNRYACYPTDRWVGGGRSGGHWIHECGAFDWINASMSVEGRTYTTLPGQTWPDRVRNLGTWDRRPFSWDLTENWTDTAHPDYAAFIGTSNAYHLKDRALCKTDTYKRCAAGAYTKNSNSVKVRGKYGDRIRLGIHVQSAYGDLDCLMANYTTWTKAKVEESTSRTPHRGIMSVSDGSGNTKCLVEFSAVASSL